MFAMGFFGFAGVVLLIVAACLAVLWGTNWICDRYGLDRDPDGPFPQERS